ncbi:hypothetical protein [Kutzneria kofuensis]|uniref:hypothetical protein n=1 Tax=Kutzneria kofuensis TaxID=103725 RepID=UPI0031E8F470
MTRTSISESVVGNAIYEVYTLAAPPSRAATLPVLLATLRGPRKPQLTAEQAIAQFRSWRRCAAPGLAVT